MSEWKPAKLLDVAEIIMGQSPSGETCNDSEGIPLLNGPTEFTGKFPLPVQYTTDPKRFSEKGDILFCVRGSTTGKMNWSDQVYAIGRGIAAIRHKKRSTANYFIKGLIEYSLEELLAGATGSTFPNVSRTDLENIEILLPPLPEQEAIAEVLSSLDDKIDLLHRNNKTLEQLAETLFRQWFVEEAKESWEEVPFEKIAQHIKKSINPSQDKTQQFYHYSLPAFDNGRRPELSYGSEILSNKYEVMHGSILVSKLNPATPRIWYVIECEKHSISSTEFQVYKAKDASYQEFIYYFLKSPQARDILTGAASGTSGSHQRVSPDVINSLLLKTPPSAILQKFSATASIGLKKMYENMKQIQQLEILRNTLLPKLMGGVVRVK